MPKDRLVRYDTDIKQPMKGMSTLVKRLSAVLLSDFVYYVCILIYFFCQQLLSLKTPVLKCRYHHTHVRPSYLIPRRIFELDDNTSNRDTGIPMSC